jgi:putative nucleotidyltransferase with HDIG domain
MAGIATTETQPIADGEARRIALERLFSRLSEVTPLPATCQKLMQLTSEADASVEDVRKAIQADPALVAKILRRVNSSYYGLSHKVSDIRTAVNLLGMANLRNLTLTIFSSRMFASDGDHKCYRRGDLWSHSVAVASIAALIARVCGRPGPEDAYTAGLLHDFGYIVLDQNLRRHFCNVVDELSETTPTHVVEARIYSFDHAAVGGFVARKWKFAEGTCDAITYHHRPDEYQGNHGALVAVTSLANYLVSRYGHTSLGIHNTPSPSAATFAQLGLDQATLAVIGSQLEETIRKSSALATM